MAQSRLHQGVKLSREARTFIGLLGFKNLEELVDEFENFVRERKGELQESRGNRLNRETLKRVATMFEKHIRRRR